VGIVDGQLPAVGRWEIQAAEKLDLPDKFVRKIPQGLTKAAMFLLN
jgi:hypothetical protein